MYKGKRFLLIAGGGTLGTHVYRELLGLGGTVDVICLEDTVSDSDRLTFYKGYATEELLVSLFGKNRYDGIVNFLHYNTVEEYRPMHELLSENTEHLIFLSSYRVYADLEQPVVESSPRLLDTSTDRDFLENEKYAIAKAKCEDYLFNESKTKNWTIVRPVISFSRRRFDIAMCSNHEVEEKALSGEPIIMPIGTRNKTAGLDWSGNVGKIIAHLLLKKDAFGEAYTASAAENLTWGEIADIYTDILGVKFEWISDEEYIEKHLAPRRKWIFLYDRLFDRKIDNTKVLCATGLSKSDFKSIRWGVEAELRLAGAIK
ncbi:MAG: NAD-dependent epimerase/dehydratase family protein [Clostridia bacterium]|nr:NAD-dependent epimerase/dehydratase family protein [Clostridia bacterium]